MATGRCEACGADEYMPYVCKFCQGRYCAAHRLPENHDCQGLGEYRARMRQEGRMIAPEPQTVAPKVSAGARVQGKVDELIDRISGKATPVLLAGIVGTFFLQVLTESVGGPALHNALFVLDPAFYLTPWTLVTSVFAHGGFNHLFFNGIVLFFFGPVIERAIGTKRFLYLFLGGGVLAGLAQIMVFSYLLPLTGSPLAVPWQNVVGASGGIMALLGCLTILAPKMRVLIMFVIPAPLWAITAFYAVFDLLGAFSTGSGIAHVAHLAGLGAGLWYGKKLQDEGLRIRMGQPQGVNYGRYF